MTEELLESIYERLYALMPDHIQRDMDEDPWRRLAFKCGILQQYLRMKAEEN